MKIRKVLITGAAGNIGGLLAQHLLNGPLQLNLMVHKTELPAEIEKGKNVTVFRADLSRPETLAGPCQGVDCIVHFAGVLFKPGPEKFLPVTNTLYFKNLVDTAIECGVKRIILISFPHVEGETTPENPATGRLNGDPISVHARTRLEEERYLFGVTKNSETVPVSLRVGMVYSEGILMIDTARWLARHWLLGVWRKPTRIHLISTPDYLSSVEAAITGKEVSGIYHIGDENPVTLQEFLDRAAVQWHTRKPWRLPVWLIMLAARLCELTAIIIRTRSLLTRDFVRIGMVSYYGDTTRMREELLPELKYPGINEGIELLK